MSIRKTQVSLKQNDIIFIIGFSVFLISTILSATMWVYLLGDGFEFVLKIARYIAYAICSFKIFASKFNFSNILTIVLISISFILSGFFSHSMLILTYIFIFCSAYGIKKEQIIKYSLIIQGILSSIIIISSKIGLSIDYIFGVGERNRHGLGFVWTTTAPILYFFMILEYVYLRKNKIKTLEIFIIEIINYLLFLLTDARMSFFLSTLSIIYFWGLTNIRWMEMLIKRMSKLFVFFPFLISSFAYYIHSYYSASSEKWVKLNDLLSGRLQLGKVAITRYGITVFGQEINWIGYSYNAKGGVYNYVDSSYLQILLQYGIVFLIMCVLLYSYILYKADYEKDYYLCGGIIIILVFSITEPRLMNLMYNPFPLLAMSYLAETRNKHWITIKVR